MESIEHYEKFIENKIKLLHRVNKKTAEIIESKQITEIEKQKIFHNKAGRDRRVKNESDRTKMYKG